MLDIPGMAVDQTRLEFENAYEIYRQRPSAETGKALIKAAGAHLKANPKDFGRYGPTLAIMHTLEERGHLTYKSFRGKIGYRLANWGIQRWLGDPVPPKRPGWNDYYMVRWQLTKEQRHANEIHRRTHYTDPHGVGFTATWMAESQRQQNPEFDAALLVAELECGCKKMHRKFPVV